MLWFNKSGVRPDNLHLFHITMVRDFPGGPVVKGPWSQRKGPRFDPWSGM